MRLSKESNKYIIKISICGYYFCPDRGTMWGLDNIASNISCIFIQHTVLVLVQKLLFFTNPI